jgi:hypothetical protein
METRAGRLVRAMLLAAGTQACAQSPAAAQGGEWPTLSGLGVEYLSPSGAFQVSLSGQLDLESLLVAEDRWGGLVGGSGADSVPADWVSACADCHRAEAVPKHGRGGHVSAHRLRVFADIFLGDHVYSLVEVRSDRGPAPSNGRVQVGLEQAYLRLVGGGGTVGVEVGRFASPFGAYAPRHLSGGDPFLRPPLPYDYRTIMSYTHAPPDAAALVSWEEVREGRFRRDLYYRLNVFPLTLPTLRERREDIPQIVSHLVQRLARALGKPIDVVPPQVMELLESHDWPGNIRELENVLQRAIILSSSTTLTLRDAWMPASQAAEPCGGSTLAEMERRHIANILDAAQWRIEGRGGAAQVLGLKPSTLRSRMVKLGIARPR